MPAWTLRTLTPADEAEWIRMRRRLFPDCSEDLHAFERHRIAQKGDAYAVFVVDAGGGLAGGERLGGFVEVSVREQADGATSERVGYVEAWYVEPALRGLGVGRALIAEAEAWCRARDLTELASDTELDNTASQRAHEALGFRETYRIVQYLKPL